MRQRNVQMRLEKLNRFVCFSVALTIVAGRSNRCEAPALPRMCYHSFLEQGCMYFAVDAANVHALDRCVCLAKWQFFFET